jgi:hypothetical protein
LFDRREREEKCWLHLKGPKYPLNKKSHINYLIN